MAKTSWKKAWRYRCKSKAAQNERRKMKESVSRFNRRKAKMWLNADTEGSVAKKEVLNAWDVI